MHSYITKEMEQPTPEQIRNISIYKAKRENMIKKEVILTSRILIFVFKDNSVWTYYPVTKIESYEGVYTDETHFETLIDRVLREHNWFNRDVENVMCLRKENRNGNSLQF